MYERDEEVSNFFSMQVSRNVLKTKATHNTHTVTGKVVCMGNWVNNTETAIRYIWIKQRNIVYLGIKFFTIIQVRDKQGEKVGMICSNELKRHRSSWLA